MSPQDQATQRAKEHFTPLLEKAHHPALPIFAKILSTNSPLPGQASFKIWPKDRNADQYVELIAFNGNPIHADRKLFLLKAAAILHLETTKNERATWIEVSTEYLEEVDLTVTEPPLSFAAQAYDMAAKPVVPQQPTPPAAASTAPPPQATAPAASHLDDEPLNQMTMRDLYAIIQNQPVSYKPWLNSIIQSCQTPPTKTTRK